jgi:hypothetical protein
MGGRDKTENFFRLFLIPGVHHGGGGPGLTEIDSFSALEDWVEKGQAPDKLIAGRMNNGQRNQRSFAPHCRQIEGNKSIPDCQLNEVGPKLALATNKIRYLRCQ